MRSHPIAPARLNSLSSSQRIHQGDKEPGLLERKGRPYLDGIEYTIIRNLSTAVLGFVAGNLT